MDRGQAYRTLIDRLEKLKSMPIEDLMRSVGQKTSEQVVLSNGDQLAVEVEVDWRDDAKTEVRIRAIGDLVSAQSLQRLEEIVLVSVPDSLAREWCVWRLDDNGNEIQMRSGLTRGEAESIAAEFTERGHKQTYWVSKHDANPT